LSHIYEFYAFFAVLLYEDITLSLIFFQRHHATVSVIHAFTTNPEAITRESDIVISAAGVANLVRGSWLKQGAVVIDVGTNPIEVKPAVFIVLSVKTVLCCLCILSRVVCPSITSLYDK
jgi:hypothetical protein